jgi:two-component system OmpR family sensor kinase/two-component system sensor histidine kinase BaeS
MERAQCEWRGQGPWSKAQHWRPNGRVGRARFFRRLATIAFILLVFGIWGLASLVRLALGRLFGFSSSAAAGWVPIATLLTAFAAATALLRMVRRVGLPFRDVMEAAERVADGDYAVRVAESGPPPIRGLARAFNAMTERLGTHEQQRRNLMADVAHELRTPLTIIQGKVEGLLDGVYPRDDSQLREILDETNMLSRLVEDLRTLALSESGTLQLQKDLTDIAELAREVIQAFAAEASARHVALSVDAPAGLPPIVIDAVRIRQVLNNLISNALQHTPAEGSVKISVTATNETEILVQVRDTGRGMNQAELERAFDRFHKGPDSRGSGLGLPIARNLVLAHGGEMRATSQPGSGSTISFTLPY